MSKSTPPAQTDYGKWIADALAANPRLSQAGLARHMNYGTDRSRVPKMISGYRRIQIDELAGIASYLGVPPPGVPFVVVDDGQGIPVAGRIASGVWYEAGAAPTNDDLVTGVADGRWPKSQQAAYIVGERKPEHCIDLGDILVTVPWGKARPAHQQDGDLVIIERKRGDLLQLALAKAVQDGAKGKLAPVIGSSEEGKPVALVIALHRKMS